MADFNKTEFVHKAHQAGWKVQETKGVHVSVSKETWKASLRESSTPYAPPRSSNLRPPKG